jgi:hypothetical protein
VVNGRDLGDFLLTEGIFLLQALDKVSYLLSCLCMLVIRLVKEVTCHPLNLVVIDFVGAIEPSSLSILVLCFSIDKQIILIFLCYVDCHLAVLAVDDAWLACHA